MNIECVGGPKDGEVIAVQDSYGCLEVAVFDDYDIRNIDLHSLVYYKVGRYEPVTEVDRLLHRWIWKAPT